MLTTAELRQVWAPACRGPWVTVNLHGSGSISVRPVTKDAWLALNRVLVKWNYRTRRADTGAYNCRHIAGTSRVSLHGYAIAGDLNWQSNPRRRPLTTDMPAGMVAEIEAIRTNNGAQVFRWGGHFSTPDAMHFEICCAPRDLAFGIRGTTPTPTLYREPTVNPDEEEIEMFYLRRKSTGAVWRFHGNTARHLSPDALELDLNLGKLAGKPVKILDVDEEMWRAFATNALDTRTGKAIVL